MILGQQKVNCWMERKMGQKASCRMKVNKTLIAVVQRSTLSYYVKIARTELEVLALAKPMLLAGAFANFLLLRP